MYSTVFWKLLFLYNFAHIVGQPGPGLCETVSKRRGGRKEGGGGRRGGGGEGGGRRGKKEEANFGLSKSNPKSNHNNNPYSEILHMYCKASATNKRKISPF